MRVPLSLGFLLLVSCSAPSGFSQSSAAPVVTTPGDGRVAEWMYGEHISAVPRTAVFRQSRAGTRHSTPGWHPHQGFCFSGSELV